MKHDCHRIIAGLVILLCLGSSAPARGDMPDARQELIDRMVQTAKTEYQMAMGNAQRAHYSGDRYVCKNFAAYLFYANSASFRMAEYPEAALVMPGNLPREECAPYVYGVGWKDVAASQGNPFVAVATFRYDPSLSRFENIRAAFSFMRQVKKGDFLQMAAKYEHGIGPHSLLFLSDFNETGTGGVRWADSNMLGYSAGGVRYGYIQFDKEKRAGWFAKAFCFEHYGATLYRLREDIMYAPEEQNEAIPHK